MVSMNYVLELLLSGHNTKKLISKMDKFSTSGGFFFTITIMCVGSVTQ